MSIKNNEKCISSCKKPLEIKFFNLILICFSLVILQSCNLDSLGDEIGGKQSPIGEVGNTIDWTVSQFGLTDVEMVVTKLENGISTFKCSGTTENSVYIDMLKMVPTDRFPGTFTVIGNTVEATVDAKITDEGVQAIFEDGSKLTLVDYEAKVGDKFKTTIGGVTLENEIVEKSTEDDFYWAGILIKVIVVKYKSHAPGISYVEHIYNHKFGLVSVAIYFEDGTVKYAGAVC